MKAPSIAGWARLAASARDRILLNLEGDAANLATSTAEHASLGYRMAALALRLFRKGKPDEPIRLLAADTGEVMAVACPHCRNVHVSGYFGGGFKPNDPRRAAMIDLDLGSASRCCHCECGTLTGPLGRECEACAAKEKPFRDAARAEHARLEENDVARFDAWLRQRLATWGVGQAGEWPITLTHGRDGIGVLAFPLELDEVPRDVNERMDALEWFEANHAAQFGRGKTPEEALADLRARAVDVRREAESDGKGR